MLSEISIQLYETLKLKIPILGISSNGINYVISSNYPIGDYGSFTTTTCNISPESSCCVVKSLSVLAHIDNGLLNRDTEPALIDKYNNYQACYSHGQLNSIDRWAVKNSSCNSEEIKYKYYIKDREYTFIEWFFLTKKTKSDLTEHLLDDNKKIKQDAEILLSFFEEF